MFSLYELSANRVCERDLDRVFRTYDVPDLNHLRACCAVAMRPRSEYAALNDRDKIEYARMAA